MNDDEALSRLIDGDLEPAEADALRLRIRGEPQLAARYARLQAAIAALRSLPAELPPPGRPAALGPAPTVDTAPRAGSWRPLAAALAGAALAAGVLLGLRAPPPRAVLVGGSSVIDGRADVLAGGIVVQVDGRAQISVEPPPGGAREDAAELAAMDRSHLAAALAGALVTVTVYEGRAWLEPEPGAEPLAVGAGDSRTLGVGSGSAAPRVTGDATDLAAANARIRELEGELGRARLEAGVARGLVSQSGGAPSPWPSPTPNGFAPGEWRERLDAAVAEVPGARVLGVDCDEYPCIAVLTRDGGGERWLDALGTLHEGMNRDGLYGEDLAVTGMASVVADDAGEAHLYAFAMEPGGTGPNPRTQTRTRDLLDDWSGELGGAAPGRPDDVEQLRTLGYVDAE